MRTRVLIPVLVALVALPVTAGFAAPTQSAVETTHGPATAGGGDASTVAEIGDATAVSQTRATATASSGSGGASGTAARSTDAANFTRLYVDAERPYLRLKPGGSDAYTVTVENGEDHAVELDPHVYVPPVGGPVVESSWVTIDGPTSLAAGEEAEYTVSVAVPDDAEVGRYSGQVAFTDQTVTYPGRPARPVHAEHLRVEVWQEPTVKVHSDTYVHAQVEAGEEMTREIVVENTGDEPVPVNPELARDRVVCRGDCPDRFDRSWLDVDAPSRIGPGETATVSVTIAPPADAERGRYRTELTLGLKDPNRDRRDAHWQRVDVSLEVWRQPDAPFETTFDVRERAEDVRLTLTPRSGPYRPDATAGADPAGFDVEFVGPNGSVVDANRVRVTDRGFVDMRGDDRRTAGDGEFAVRNGAREFVYAIDDPAAGEWTLRVVPEDTVGFRYEITRNEAD